MSPASGLGGPGPVTRKDRVLAAMTGRVRETYEALGIRFVRNGRAVEHPFHCPLPGHTHCDRKASASLNKETGLWHCHHCNVGGDVFELVARLCGLTDFQDQLAKVEEVLGFPSPSGNGRKPDAVYIYQTEAGVPARKLRFGHGKGKSFLWQRNENGRWINGLNGMAVGLYRESEIDKGNDPLLLCEGEKDTDAAVAIGFNATCSPNGGGKNLKSSKKWLSKYNARFKGRNTVLVAHADEEGQESARQLAYELYPVAERLRVIWNLARDAKDLYEFFAHGGTVEELDQIIEATPDWELDPGSSTKTGEEPPALSAPEILLSLGPDPEPLVDGLFVPGTAGLFNSNPGDGKTTATDSLALSVTTGDSVFGHFEVPHTANALLVQLEDGTRRHIRRLQRLARGMGIDGLPAGLFIWRFEGGFALDNEEHLARLEGFIREKKIALVVIDPFVYTHSKDENDNRAMADLLFPIKQLATETGAVIILVHHYNKPTSDKAKTGGARIRGGTVIWGWRDFAFYFSRSGDARRVDIENKDLGNQKFILRLVRQEDGGERLEYQEFIEGVAERNRQKMLDALRDLSKTVEEDDGWVPVRKVGERAGLKAFNTMKDHTQVLFEEGAVEYDAERKVGGSKRPCIRLTEED